MTPAIAKGDLDLGGENNGLSRRHQRLAGLGFGSQTRSFHTTSRAAPFFDDVVDIGEGDLLVKNAPRAGK